MRYRILSIVSLLGIWLVLTTLFPANIVPGPAAVGSAMLDNFRSGQTVFHLYKTLVRVGFGLMLTMLLGMAFGAAMGLSKRAEIFLDA